MTYTTVEALTTRMSSIGVELRSDHDFDAIAQSIQWGSVEIDFYLQARYPAVDFSTNGFASFAACVLAVYHLCWTRLNAVPSAVQKERDDLIAKLKDIQAGRVPLPGTASPGSAPTLLNARVMLGSYPPIVTETNRSTGPGVPSPKPTDPFPLPRYVRPF